MRSLLLDTNVVVWLLLGDSGSIPVQVQHELEDINNRVVVSALSVWEIALKRSLDKLAIDDNWLQALAGLDLSQMPITANHAAAIQDLPFHHRDPFDRLLVATAMSERLTLVSADRQLSAYDVDVMW